MRLDVAGAQRADICAHEVREGVEGVVVKRQVCQKVIREIPAPGNHIRRRFPRIGSISATTIISALAA